MADHLAFSDIYAGVELAVKGALGSKRDLIKLMINMVYLNEILVADPLYPLFWLVKFDDSFSTKAPATITNITAASPPVITAEAHGFVSGDIVSIHNVVGMTELNNRFFLVDDEDDDTFELQDLDDTDIVGAGDTAYTSGGTAHHRGITPSVSIQSVLNAQLLDEIQMTVISREELMKDNTLWNENTARPERWMHTKHFTTTGTETNRILFFKGADAAYRMQYWYLLRGSRLIEDTDVPLLPPEFHHTIVSGTVTRLIESNVQVENQIIWPGIYTSELNALKTFNRKHYQDNEVRNKPFMI
ncbi:hypothetical protein ES708_04639 [subsurface metagenome]